MLCTLTKEDMDMDEYIYEIKWDGYRIISYVENGKVRMDSRSALDYTKKYPPIKQALETLQHDVVLDGEVVVFDHEGKPSFDALQKFNGHSSPINYCVFDILWLDGNNLMTLPLIERKTILKEIVKDIPVLRYSESFENGMTLFDNIVAQGLEGIVAKRKESEYVPGDRSRAWLKKPTRIRQEFVIGGWAESERGRQFRSLLFGAYNDDTFEWIGRSGGGYKEKDMPGILKLLKELEIPKSPFKNKVLDTKGAILHWVKPQLVANFEFAAWTTSGRIRKPATFLGFRNDKNATDVVREVPIENSTSETSSNHEHGSKDAGKPTFFTMDKSNWPEVEKQHIANEHDFDIGECTISLNNVQREIWKGITKAQLINYYHSVASYILPYLLDRPQSLHLKLINANGPGLFIKDMEGRQPDCATIFKDKRRHHVEGKRDEIDYLVCNNEATLLWMINLGCIDINPWNSIMQRPNEPDFIVVDLDPTPSNNGDVNVTQLVETAIATKNYCDKVNLKAFAKTSGKTGMHFYIPCAGISSEQARAYAENICKAIHQLAPDSSTIQNSISKRDGKVYIDPSQNDYADTLAAPYSVRPYHAPTVSTPLEWNEINHKLNPSVFTINTILKRLDKKGDLFENVLDNTIAIANTEVLKGILK